MKLPEFFYSIHWFGLIALIRLGFIPDAVESYVFYYSDYGVCGYDGRHLSGHPIEWRARPGESQDVTCKTVHDLHDPRRNRWGMYQNPPYDKLRAHNRLAVLRYLRRFCGWVGRSPPLNPGSVAGVVPRIRGSGVPADAGPAMDSYRSWFYPDAAHVSEGACANGR